MNDTNIFVLVERQGDEAEDDAEEEGNDDGGGGRDDDDDDDSEDGSCPLGTSLLAMLPSPYPGALAAHRFLSHTEVAESPRKLRSPLHLHGPIF